MTFFRLYPKYRNEKEETVDRICEHYGLLLVIGGLCMEVAGEVVTIPAELLGVGDIEAEAFTAGFLFWLVVVFILVRMAILLIMCRPDYPGGPTENTEAEEA